MRQAVTLIRGGRPHRRRRDPASPSSCARRWAAWAGPPRPRRPAARPVTAGSRSRRWSRWPRRPTGLTTAEFVADLDRRASEQHAPAAGGVTLSTLHAAKGLEWDAVFLAGMHDGAMPLTHATTAAEIEEERRLLYVGMTRARVHLTVSWAAARTPGGRGNRRPSRFLDRLLPDEARAAERPAQGAGAPSTAASAASRCRSAAEKKRGRCADCPASYDEELFERLRVWRKARADEERCRRSWSSPTPRSS